MKKTFCIILTLMLMITAVSSLCASAYTTGSEISVDPIDFNNPDFIRGMDVSSVLSLERSGVRFYTADGRQEDLFGILADSGVNYIRVRVWNDPYDSSGYGYGGGNNDVSAAAEIGRRAAMRGMKLLVDFHYSDFWADPSKQKAPKAWSGLTAGEKAEAVRSFTGKALASIREAGADIGMVQIGNEINSGIAGEDSWQNMALILNAGSAAVRAFDPDVLVAVHFTNPEKTDYIKSLADYLHDFQVDYDVFAVSYYPYWHGSLSNLKSVLDYAAVKYKKYAIVAETSYANTLDDSDGHPNTVSRYTNNSGSDLLWDFSPQGQADELKAVMSTVNDVSSARGLGVFYWEGAWITVGDTTGLSGSAYNERLSENKALWERDGSGWAASFSADYDPDDAGKWYGGSAVDNQAFFSPDGKALPSLSVFARVCSSAYILGDTDGNGDVESIDATYIQRYCACMDIDITENIIMHGDADRDGEPGITDATYIQRYLAQMSTPFSVGGWTI